MIKNGKVIINILNVDLGGEFMILRDSIINKGEFDVLVVGGGIAGVSAALASRRKGKSVCLFEKSVTLGGLATLGLVNWYEPLCDGNGKKIMGGLTEELIRLSIKDSFNTLDDKWLKEEKMTKDDKRFSTFFSPTLFTIKLNELLIKEGVVIRYDSLMTYPVMDENRVEGIIVETVSGSEYYKGKVVIDASGNATVFSRAGSICKTGENYLGYLSYIADFNDEIKEKIQLRKWVYSGSNMFGNGHPEGQNLLVGDTSDDVNLMIIKGQLLLSDRIKKTSNSEIVNLPGMPQFRMIKHIVGEYELTEEDMYKEFDDSIGIIGNFMERNEWLEIPFRTLYNKNYPNLLSCGRIISAEGKAWNMTRVIPCCVLTGEACGIAASMMIDNNIEVQDINVKELQEKLISVGNIIHP